MRRIEIIFEETGTRATAVLQDEDAPATCNALWGALEQPIVAEGIHAAWAGREIMMNLPPSNQNFDPTTIPKENLTLYPCPGDFCWAYFPERFERGEPDEIWDLALIYGRETRFEVAFGPCPMTLWAIIDDGLAQMADECERVRTEGLKSFRISRLS